MKQIIDTQIIQLLNQDHESVSLRSFVRPNNRSALIYFHGIEGHSEWFSKTANNLATQGFDVYAYDRIGCGLSSGQRGHIRSINNLIKDSELIINYIAVKQYQSIGYLASCWGAKLALLLTAKLAFKPNYLILTSPAIFTKIDLSFINKLKLVYYALKQRNLDLIPLPITTTMLTTNPDYFDYLNTDPLRNRSLTVNAYIENLKIDFMAIFMTKQSFNNIDLPILLCLAQDDKIINRPKILNWFAKIKSGQKEIKTFPTNSHCLDFDAQCYNVYITYLLEWLNKIVK